MMGKLLSEDDSSLIAELASWRCLAELGYTFSRSKRKASHAGAIVSELMFENSHKNRCISFFRFSEGIGAVFIKNTSERVHRGFGVEDWLEYHVKDNLDGFTLEQYRGIKFAKNRTDTEPLFNFLESLFLGPLKSLLLGETWDEVPWLDKYR